MTTTRVNVSGKKVEVLQPGTSTFGWAIWCVVSGFISILTASILNEAFKGRASFSLFIIGMVIQVTVAYVVVLGAARARFANASFLSSARWIFGREPLARLASSLLISVAFLFMIALSSFALDATTLNVYAFLTMLLTMARGLRYVYLAQYLDFIDPNAKTEAKSDRSARDRVMQFVRPKRWNLIAPIVQSLVVTVISSELIVFLGVTVFNLPYLAVTIIIGTALPAVGAGWAQWHIWGGVTRILRIGAGRQMRAI